MDISLQTSLASAGYKSGGSNTSIGQQGLSPMPGILDAQNVVVLGASIMVSAFGGNSVTDPFVAAYAQAAGFTGTLQTRAVSGQAVLHTVQRHAEVAAEPVIASGAGQNVYVVHTGGNNVSASRPWPGGGTQFAADYQSLMQAISQTDTVVPVPLTKRLYPNAPAVIDGDAASEVNGSKPYNDNIIHPAIDQYASSWRTDGGAAFVDPYDLAHRYPWLLGPDGVHGFGASLGRYILARLAGRAKGIEPTQSRAGKSFLYSVARGEPNEMSIGAVNTFLSYGVAGFLNNPLLCGAIATDGSFDPFVEVSNGSLTQGASNNAGTETFARLPDTRFHVPDLVNNGIYVQGTKVYDLDFAHLTPGDVVTISAVGVRAAAGTNRRASVSLSTGQTLELDASRDAVSNQVTFAPVTVPADGKLSLSTSVAPGSSYGYLHGVLLEFS